MEKELGKKQNMDEVKNRLKSTIGKIFNMNLIE
jgi:hypothetical protein